MPSRPMRPCKRPGCPAITRDKSGYCDEHQTYVKERKAAAHRSYDKTRGKTAARGYDGQWRKVRAMKLSRDPLCELCLDQGETVAAELVHHIEPVKERPDLRLFMENLKSVCKPCHERLHKGGGPVESLPPSLS